jgi:hypothetical protein
MISAKQVNHMKTIFQIFLALHIAAGMLALVTGSISLFNRKGGKAHRRTGILFFAGMCGVFVTSIYLSLAKHNWFLLVTGCFSFYMAASGYRSLFLKKLHLGQKAALPDWMIGGGGILFGLGMYALAYWMLPQKSFGIVPIVFGSICLVMAIGDLRKFYRRPTKKTHWIVSHGFRMGGAYVAAVTAFLVVNVQMQPVWVPWLLPSVIVPFFIVWQIRKYLGGGKIKPQKTISAKLR